MQSQNREGRLARPVRRTGGRAIETVLMTRYGALELKLDSRGYFVLTAQSRSGQKLIVQEGNLHALLDVEGLLEPEVAAKLVAGKEL